MLTERKVDHIILHGGHYTGPARAQRLEMLDYSERPNKLLYDEALKLASQHLGGPPNIWHLHNPTLGKNYAFPEFVYRIASSMTPLLLQTHDFAEDGRPKNYQKLADLTYPIAPQIAFATLNHRDANMLRQLGVDNVSVLPPPVDTHSIQRKPSATPLLLYPVRGIRRKNLGEASLIAAVSHLPIAVTLPPRNPEWIPFHDRWRNLAHELRLNIEFSVTDRIAPNDDHDASYEAWLEHCTHILTTSIAEGFGLAFLEPITHQIPVIGRDLPEITQDFTNIHQGNLYQNLLVPRSWVDARAVTEIIREQFVESHLNYNYPLTTSHRDQLWEHLNRFPNHFDFGELSEDAQEEIIRLIKTSPELGKNIVAQVGNTTIEFPTWLESVLNHPCPSLTSAEPWSSEKHAENLLDTYKHILNAEPKLPEWLDNTALLPYFLKPNRFRILHS